MDSTTVETWSQFGMDKINDLIDAVKLAAPKLWEIYVRQVTVEAWVGMVVPMICLIIFAPICLHRYQVGHKNYSAEKGKSQHNAGWSDGDSLWYGVFLVLTIASLGLTIGYGTYGALVVNNPEYYAIQRILGR